MRIVKVTIDVKILFFFNSTPPNKCSRCCSSPGDMMPPGGVANLKCDFEEKILMMNRSTPSSKYDGCTRNKS